MYIGLLILLAAIGWFAYEASGKQSGGDSNQTVSGSQNSGTLASLLSSPMPQECTFSSPEATGTAYIATNRMRGDFSTETAGVKQTGHIIAKNDMSYVWIDGQTQGFSMATTSASADSDTMPMSMEDKVKYSCKAWKVDEAKFAQPTSVKFTNYTDLMTQLQANPGDIDLSKLGL